MTLIIGIHGFGYDPDEPENDPRESIYLRWREQSRPFSFRGFAWYSYPFGICHVARAWRKGHIHRYTAAWDEALMAGERLARYLRQVPRECQLIAHSLGTRVALHAAERTDNISRILLLSGADSVTHAMKCIKGTDAKVLNVIVPDDSVLEFPGRWFTPKWGTERVIGFHGLPTMPNVLEMQLDDAKSHWDAHDGRYWPQWQAWMRGELDGKFV